MCIRDRSTWGKPSSKALNTRFLLILGSTVSSFTTQYLTSLCAVEEKKPEIIYLADAEKIVIYDYAKRMRAESIRQQADRAKFDAFDHEWLDTVSKSSYKKVDDDLLSESTTSARVSDLKRSALVVTKKNQENFFQPRKCPRECEKTVIQSLLFYQRLGFLKQECWFNSSTKKFISKYQSLIGLL
eukprot:TRINITY_DN4052_c0_g3_i2.p1 TRINITY_DN4052_c0_g3~~TRINITY_DN4052_c0_g3_i2.p1  ORF type:complete len:185 (-),score=23.14 TRINITY_DN4052_c0_g3_i2:215-769(-)